MHVKKEALSIKKMIFSMLLAVVFLAGCQGKADEDVGSKESSTSETTEISEMTSLENDVFQTNIDLLKENVASYKSTGKVLDGEKILATIQEIYTMNLSESQKEEANRVIQQLPKEYAEFQQALVGAE